MNVDDITQERQAIERELKHALSTMEKKETIFELKKRLEKVQNECPHIEFAKECPYCGKKLG